MNTDPRRAVWLDRMTDAQIDKIINLGGNPSEFHPVFDLPRGWVAGWAGGIYYGIEPRGDASS